MNDREIKTTGWDEDNYEREILKNICKIYKAKAKLFPEGQAPWLSMTVNGNTGYYEVKSYLSPDDGQDEQRWKVSGWITEDDLK